MLGLETFSELCAAAHIYTSLGFELVSADTGPRWGRDEITYQRYELALGADDDRSALGGRLAGRAAATAPPSRSPA